MVLPLSVEIKLTAQERGDPGRLAHGLVRSDGLDADHASPRAGGPTNPQISIALDITDRTDGSWCNRFAEPHPDELDHEPRSGRPRCVGCARWRNRFSEVVGYTRIKLSQ